MNAIRTPLVTIGFEWPSQIRDHMSRIDSSADQLDQNVQSNVSYETDFRTTWNRWLAGWREFRDKYEGISPTIWTNSEEVSRQTSEYDRELQNWYQAYAQENNPLTGRPLGRPTAVPPGGAPRSIPSWLVLALLAGGGYLGYRYLSRRDGERRRGG